MAMAEEYIHMNEEERTQAENDFLKMKLMLEKDAHFDICSNGKVPPIIENEFLKNVIEFEKQFEARRMITVFDKIGKPDHFKPAKEIPDEQIDSAWKKLDDFMHAHGIGLDACSPNVSNREMYRFAIEELFVHEIEDIDIPGLMHCFIYDEFHPDPVYDNTRHAVDDCIAHMLEKRAIEWVYCFRNDDLKLNEHYPLNIAQFKEKVNRFKAAYEDIEIKEIRSEDCAINKTECIVRGTYAIDAMTSSETIPIAGIWKVYFHLDEEFDFWNVTTVEIEGIKF
jgi:hypothetical protein